MNRLKVGIAGLGDFGELYCTVLSQLHYVEITRVCSRTESRAREIAGRYGIPATSTDYEEFARATDIDVACVVTLGRDHLPVVLPALQSGKHVLVEKPMADSIEDAEAMVRASKESAGKFMVGHICRFMPPYLYAKERIEGGELGTISMIQAYRNNHYSTLAPGRKKNPMRETAIHDIDLALWFTGSEIEESTGYRRYNRAQEEADSCVALVKLKNGTMCSFASSWLLRDGAPAGLDAMMKVIGDRGEIEIHMPPANIRLIDDTRHAHSNPETSHSPVILKQSALAAEIEYFLGCIMRDEIPSIVTPEEAFRALSSAVRIDESSEEIR